MKRNRSEFHAAYHAAHKQEIHARKHAYSVAHKDDIAAKSAAYYAAHKEQIAASKKAYREANKDKIAAYLSAHEGKLAAYQAAYYEAHREQVRIRVAAHRAAHKGAETIHWQRRRARELQADGTHTVTDIKDQYARQKGKCFWCGKRVGKQYHVDHVVPLSRGGGDGLDNLVIACPTCNMQKGDKLPHEWIQGGRLI